MPAYILVAIAAYLLGSIPTGYLMAKAKGIDIRSVGSGNIGATNAMRVLGKPIGIFVLVVDALKGFGAVLLAGVVARQLNEFLPNVFTDESLANPETKMNLAVIAGLFAVLGHNYTCWLKFKGGKGIATTAGVYFALAPLSVGIALGVWILLFVTTRYVSVASIAAAAALPIAVWLTQKNLLLGIVTTLLGALAIYKHKSNLQRLRAGTENRINFKK
ncbi:MAG: glycerol-3-phosphate 1-O-acyltransferase [Verrucomicrobia bacterium]|nr:MAG: glycerol-3-phosphate 1-O-acyltransferase [Verrucomicrobiota bacterium]